MKIDSEALLKLVNSTSFSMGYQDARHFLNGLYIEFSQSDITAVATDGHRLAYSSRDCELPSSGKSCIVPRKCINELKRILSSFSEINGILTEVYVSSKNIQFNIHGYKLLSKMGWKAGKGLGAKEDGKVAPVGAEKGASDKSGAAAGSTHGVGSQHTWDLDGTEDVYEQYRKRMMLGYRHRPNPNNNPRKLYY